MKSLQACTSKEIENQGFCIVIGIVGYCKGAEPMLTAKFLKPAISEFSGSHLYADTLPGRIFFRIETLYKKADSVFIRPPSDQHLITVAFLSSEVEVAMGYGDPVFAKSVQGQVCKTH